MLIRYGSAGELSERRLACFRRVLEAAGQTVYYRKQLETARLLEPAAIKALCSIENTLARLPVLERASFLDHPESFRNRRMRYAEPWSHAGALVWSGWRKTIAGPIDVLRRLAVEVLEGRAAVPSVARRVVVHTSVSGDALSEPDRNLLWEAFGLPVFEQLRGFDGELLASECEAHAGMHLSADSAVIETAVASTNAGLLLTSLAGLLYPILRLSTGLSAVVVRGMCDCGQEAELVTWAGALPARKPMASVTAVHSTACAS